MPCTALRCPAIPAGCPFPEDSQTMTRWIGFACTLIVLSGAAVFMYQMLPESVPEPAIELHRREGPPARLELVGDKYHIFGNMAAGERGSHTWEFKNVGEGPMEVLLLETTCSCTVATLKTEAGEKKKVTVAPGESIPIEVNWEARKWGKFAQTATIGTNDPDHASVLLTVMGMIIAPVDVQPSETVAFSDISNEEPHRASLAIVSADRPELKLTRIVTSKPAWIAVEAKPMTPEELRQRKVKSGYHLTVELKPGMPLGRFNEDLMIETDHPDRPGMKLTIAGNAIGPIRVIPERLVMSAVPSRAGGSKELALIVRGGPEDAFRGGLHARKPGGLHRAG